MLEEESSKWGEPDSQSLTTSKWHAAKQWWLRLVSHLFVHKYLSARTNVPQIPAAILPEQMPANAAVSLQEQIKLLDQIQSFIQTLREQIDPKRNHDFDINLLGTNTYLHHIERVIIKIREQLLSFRYRCDQFSLNNIHEHKEFTNVKIAAQECYLAVIALKRLMEKFSPSDLYSNEFIHAANTLELKSEALIGAMRQLNQYAYRQEALLQLSQLEQQVIQSLLQSQTQRANVSFNELFFGGSDNKGISGDNLRAKLSLISEPEHILLLNDFIDSYETLKKCYVIARKTLIKETLDKMALNLESVIKQFSLSQPNKDEIYSNLLQYFNHIESLRFSSNRDSRCSRNLFDKARLVRRQLRKACAVHSLLGPDFLNHIAVKRESLVRENKLK